MAWSAGSSRRRPKVKRFGSPGRFSQPKSRVPNPIEKVSTRVPRQPAGEEVAELVDEDQEADAEDRQGDRAGRRPAGRSNRGST